MHLLVKQKSFAYNFSSTIVKKEIMILKKTPTNNTHKIIRVKFLISLSLPKSPNGIESTNDFNDIKRDLHLYLKAF